MKLKRYTVYKCDYCDFESRDFKKAEKHEAEHFGLTVEEFRHWKTLKANAQSMGTAVSGTKNEETERMFDEAVEKLLNFEKEHGIESIIRL